MTTRIDFRRANIHGGTVDLAANPWDEKTAPIFDEGRSLVELGHRFYEGQASQGTFVLRDPDADLGADFPQGHTLITLIEDDSGNDRWLARGRVASDEGGRGVVKEEDVLEWNVTVDDGNCDLRGQAFTEAWTRPAETDVARLVALQLYTLNGASSTATNHRATCAITINTSHLAPNTNTVTMPAKKYPPGTQPDEVLRDCGQTAGKVWGVVIHHSTNPSHLCLLYTTNADHLTYLSAAKISDHIEDWVPNSTTVPVLQPHWEQGAGSIHQMQTLLSGLVGVWGSSEQAAYIEYYQPIEDNYDYWVDAYHDGVSTTAAQALARTAGILEERRNSNVTHRVSVILNRNQVHLIAAGMSIDIKTAVTSQGNPDAYIRRRIAECRFEPRYDGTYWVHLDIERPPLRVAPGLGKVGPIPPVQSEPPTSEVVDWSWSYDTNKYDDQTGTVNSGGNYDAWGNPGGSVYIAVSTSSGWPGISDGSAAPATVSPGTYHFRGDWWNNKSDGVGLEVTLTGHDASHAVTVTVNSGIIAQAFHAWETYETDITFPAGTTHFTWGTSTIYKGYATDNVVLSHGGTDSGFEGTPAPPASTGSGSIGTSPIYSPSDHSHDSQSAGVTVIDDEGEYFEGGNVEEALQELAAGGPGRWEPVTDGVDIFVWDGDEIVMAFTE